MEGLTRQVGKAAQILWLHLLITQNVVDFSLRFLHNVWILYKEINAEGKRSLWRKHVVLRSQ